MATAAHRPDLIASILLVFAAALSALPLEAQGPAPFVVDSPADVRDQLPGDGVCSATAGSCTLRAAIEEANASAGLDAIVLPSGVFSLSLTGPSEDEAASGDLDITDDLSISGAGAAATEIDGGGLDRVLHIASGIALELEDLTVANGAASEAGGGILNLGDLTLSRAAVSGNRAGANGAGIYSRGSVTLTDSLVEGNVSDGLGGGVVVDGTGLLVRSAVRSNQALIVPAIGGIERSPLGGAGIGVFPQSSLTLERSVVSDNWTPGTAAGIGTFSAVTLRQSTVSGNSAGGNAGGIGVGAPAPILIENSTVSGNMAAGTGGGFGTIGGTLTLVNSTVSGNAARLSGGGISTQTTQVVLRNTTIAGNVADSDGDGIGDGGGLSVGIAVASNSILSGNLDTGGQAPDCFGALMSEGHNLVENTARCAISGETTGDIVGRAALLEPLGEYGGPTLTHLPRTGSPALDGGSPALDGPGVCEAADQRGEMRPTDGDGDGSERCDIGAVELTFADEHHLP